MSTKSKFNVGDKVVVADNSGIGVPLFSRTNVSNIAASGLVGIELCESLWAADRFVHERDFTLACINHLLDKKVELEIFNNDCGDIYYKASAYGGTECLVYRRPVMEVIDALYPTETPQQKKLRELEEQQRKIADEIKELRTNL